MRPQYLITMRDSHGIPFAQHVLLHDPGRVTVEVRDLSAPSRWQDWSVEYDESDNEADGAAEEVAP